MRFWYEDDSKKVVGPLSVEELRAALGNIPNWQSLFVWTDGSSEWKPASSFPALFPAAEAVPNFQPPPRSPERPVASNVKATPGKGKRIAKHVAAYLAFVLVAGVVKLVSTDTGRQDLANIFNALNAPTTTKPQGIQSVIQQKIVRSTPPLQRIPANPSTAACDRLAASPLDPLRPVGIDGVKDEELDASLAYPTCGDALAAAPNDARLQFEMARATATPRKDVQDAIARGQMQKDQVYFSTCRSSERTGCKIRNRLDNTKELIRLFAASSGQNYPIAQYYLGTIFRDYGATVPKAEEEMIRLYKLAADQGLAIAQYDLAQFYANGTHGLALNEPEAWRLFSLAADQGSLPTDGAVMNAEAMHSRGYQSRLALPPKRLAMFRSAIGEQSAVLDHREARNAPRLTNFQ